MGQIQDQVQKQCDKILPGERKAEVKRSLVHFNERACVFKEVALLTKSQLLCAVSEMNTMLTKSCKVSCRKVLFHCKVGEGIKWKTNSKIYCFQLDEYYKNPELTRLMNVAQFWAFRKDILQKVGKKFAREEEGEFQIVDSSGEVVKSETFDNTPEKNDQIETMSASAIFERVNNISAEEAECCICMDHKSEVSLACAHCFCKQCIDSWQNKEKDTCPLCRERISDEDEYWEMTDPPEKEEMHQYFLSLASGVSTSSSSS